MKKIFTLIAAALMAVGVNAQKYWDLSKWGNNDVTSKVTVDGLTYYGDAKSAWEEKKATITVDDVELKFTARVKMGGKSTFKDSKMSRVYSFDAKAGETVYVFGIHGSKTGTRTFYLSMNPSTEDRDVTTAFASKGLVDGESGYLTATVPSDGTVYLWADDNNGVFAISVGYTAAELAALQSGESGISNITATENVNAPAYNLAGQRVNANAKGLVIKNGKKFMNK